MGLNPGPNVRLKSWGPSRTWFLVGFVVLVVGLIVIPARHILGPESSPFAGFVAALLGILALFFAFGFEITGAALGIIRDGQNTYSLSRLQMAAWTWIILSALIGVSVARLWHAGTSAAEALNIYIPANLFMVMGISYFTGAAAPALLSLKTQSPLTAGQMQTARTRMDETNVVANGQMIVRQFGESPHFADIVEGDDAATAGTVDISKVQQLLITLLLIGVYFAMVCNLLLATHTSGDVLTHPSGDLLWSMSAAEAKSLIEQSAMLCGFPSPDTATSGGCGAGWTALPDFPASLVTLLAISHGGYLAYKAAPRAAADNSGSAPARPPTTTGTIDPTKAVG